MQILGGFLARKMKCNKCKQGHLVAEYSLSEEKTNHYCNHCFKYVVEEVAPIQDSVEDSLNWGDITDEEIAKILDDVFKDFTRN